MRTSHTHQWVTALQYLIDANDAPAAARTDAQHALDVFARIVKLNDDEKLRAHSMLQTFRTQERDLPQTVLQHVTANKRTNLDTLLHDLENARTASTTAQLRAQVAQQVYNACHHRVTGGVLQPHTHDLFVWVGKRRNAQPVTCGHIPELPDQVQLIYAALHTPWWNQWDKGLALENVNRLPLLYEPTWETDLRASLTWLWEQVANNDLELIDDQPPVYAPTKRFLRLPTVPPAVPTTPPFPF